MVKIGLSLVAFPLLAAVLKVSIQVWIDVVQSWLLVACLLQNCLTHLSRSSLINSITTNVFSLESCLWSSDVWHSYLSTTHVTKWNEHPSYHGCRGPMISATQSNASVCSSCGHEERRPIRLPPLYSSHSHALSQGLRGWKRNLWLCTFTSLISMYR